jgi:PhzF family phenazine biosynthesis protein
VSATVTHCVAFADGPGGGNPCPVVRGADGWTDAQMQAAAAAFGHETCFVLASGSDAAVRLRYFVPRHEMEMCVHATVAASALLGLSDGARVATPLGVLRVERPSEDEAIVEQFAPAFGPVVEDAGALLAALGIDPSALGAGPIRSVSTSRAKLMVPLASEALLDGLTPDHDALWSLCDDLDVTGVYAFTEAAEGLDAAARQFPVRAGYDEDPATGVAACALGAWLTRENPDPVDATGKVRHFFRIAQGRAMGRPSLIEAEATTVDGTIVGTAVGGRAAVLGDAEALAAPATRG